MAQIVIFDMDGTLVNTNRMTARAFEELAAQFGLAVPPAQVIQDAIGLADLEFYREIYHGETDDKLRPFGEAVEAREGELGRQMGEDVLFEGVSQMLRKLTEAGKQLYLASTGSQRHVSDMLASGGITGYFREIRCAQPDKRAMTAEILANAGGGSAVFVGDTLKDVQAARANGIPVLGAGYGYVKKAERKCFDRVFDTPDAMLEYLLTDRMQKSLA